MRLMAIAAAAALTACAVSSAGAAPRVKRVTPGYAAPGSTVVVHRGEDGRTRTKILVQKRSYLDGGTEVLPGDNINAARSDLLNYRPSSVIRNTGFDHVSPLSDPFFLPSNQSPFPWSGN